MKSGIKLTVSITPCLILSLLAKPTPLRYSNMQSISPGIVRTEFMPRMNKEPDIEQGKKKYDKRVDGVRDGGRV